MTDDRTARDDAAAYVTVDLEALCVLIETAQRGGVYQGTPSFDAWMAMPNEVHDRLAERAKVRTERLLLASRAGMLHHEGKAHDESICVPCAIANAEASRAK